MSDTAQETKVTLLDGITEIAELLGWLNEWAELPEDESANYQRGYEDAISKVYNRLSELLPDWPNYVRPEPDET